MIVSCWLCLIEVPELKTFDIEVKLVVGLEITFSHTVDTLFEKMPTNFGPEFRLTIAVFTIPTPLFGIPIVAVFELTAQPFYEITVEIAVEVSINPTATYTVGYKKDGGGAYDIGPTYDLGEFDNPLDASEFVACILWKVSHPILVVSVVFSASICVGVEVDIETEGKLNCYCTGAHYAILSNANI